MYTIPLLSSYLYSLYISINLSLTHTNIVYVYLSNMNELNNEWPFSPIHTDMCKCTGKEQPWRLCLTPWMCMWICLTTAYITDRSHWWQRNITFIKRLDPKIMMPHRWFINKTSLQYIMQLGQSMLSAHVLHISVCFPK